MREDLGRTGRVSNKVKAALVALIAVFAMAGFGASQASAAKQVKIDFTDSWIGVDALPGGGVFHAIDPADDPPLTVSLTGNLADNGTFTTPKSAFNFPPQVIPVEGFGNINLNITAENDITGTYNQSTGAFSATLPLKLEVVALDGAMTCWVPLNIPLATSGSKNFGPEGGDKAGTPFANGTGAALGSWTDVTVDKVTGPNAEQTEACQTIIGGLMQSNSITSFDGSIWLGGTATVTGSNVTPAKVGKITAAKKGKIKKGKTATIKVQVKNTGGTTLTGKLAIKSSNKQVKAPKSAKLNVKPGKTQTIKVKVKASKKAKGKAKITFSAGGKKAVTTLSVK
ncbi:MAG: hypothetical protein M9938_00125 [Solirubrobacterales bacterium]|nr:hypothetical protein [Solirubrobacterales bacterium]